MTRPRATAANEDDGAIEMSYRQGWGDRGGGGLKVARTSAETCMETDYSPGLCLSLDHVLW